MKNIFAFTETDYKPDLYPAYISINKHENGSFSISVRERSDDTSRSARIAISPETLEHLATDIMAFLGEEEATSKEASAPARDKALETLKAIAKIDTRSITVESVKAVAQRTLHELQSHPAQSGKEASEAAQEPLQKREIAPPYDSTYFRGLGWNECLDAIAAQAAQPCRDDVLVDLIEELGDVETDGDGRDVIATAIEFLQGLRTQPAEPVQVVTLTDELPPLPKAHGTIDVYSDNGAVKSLDGYTADQMRKYANVASTMQATAKAAGRAGGRKSICEHCGGDDVSLVNVTAGDGCEDQVAWCEDCNFTSGNATTPFLTSAQALTDEEIVDFAEAFFDTAGPDNYIVSKQIIDSGNSWITAKLIGFARTIERRLLAGSAKGEAE